MESRPYHPTVKRRRHRLLVALSLLFAASLAGCNTVGAGLQPSYDNGPFGSLGESASGWTTGAEPGSTFTDGSLVIQNHGSKPVRLVDVQFEDGEPGLDLLGAKVAGLERAIGSYQMLPSFPPVSRPPEVLLGPLSGLRDYVLPAGGEYMTKGVEVLLGVRKSATGRASRQAVLLTYEIDGKQAVARMVSTLAVCDAADRESCPQEYSDRG